MHGAIRSLIFVLFLSVSFCTAAQTRSHSNVDLTQAALIFAARVRTIQHLAQPDAGAIGRVRISLTVSEALRGVNPGQTVTLDEWDGLWRNAERYRVGQQLVFAVNHVPSNGLSSAVTFPISQLSHIRALLKRPPRQRWDRLSSDSPHAAPGGRAIRVLRDER